MPGIATTTKQGLGRGITRRACVSCIDDTGQARRWRFLLLLIALTLAGPAAATTEVTAFARPSELEPAIRFWTRVYTEVDTNAGFLHDNRHLDIVYEVVRFKPGTSRRSKQRQVNKLKARYRKNSGTGESTAS